MKFSLIIPHYNISALLDRCLMSIPVRADLQVLVVDDASNAETVKELKLLEKKYPHVDFLYSLTGKGGGAVRNAGLDAAKGDYVFFADADDFFMPCLDQVLNDVLKSKSDLFFFNAISVDTDSYTFKYRSWHLNRLIRMYSKNPQKAEFNLRYAFGEPWCKIVKRSIVEQHKIRFDETRIHNDTRYSYLIGHFAGSCVVDQRALYCVTDRSGSVSKTLTSERLMARVKVFAEANKFFKENGINRFDERAIRPLIRFLLKLDIKSFVECKRILNASGMSSFNVFFKLIVFPFFALHKALISLTQYKMRLLG